MSTQPTAIPEDVYGIFCGDINAANTSVFVKNLTTASNVGVKRVHLLFQSWGGFVGDGIFIYNLLRAFPVQIVLYNAGQVASAGALAYLGASLRKTTANAMFMIHRSTNSPQAATADKLKVFADSLVLDDARCDSIFRERLKLPNELWSQLSYHDVNVSGLDAIKFGFADEIGEFTPPPATKIFNALL